MVHVALMAAGNLNKFKYAIDMSFFIHYSMGFYPKDWFTITADVNWFIVLHMHPSPFKEKNSCLCKYLFQMYFENMTERGIKLGTPDISVKRSTTELPRPIITVFITTNTKYII